MFNVTFRTLKIYTFQFAVGRDFPSTGLQVFMYYDERLVVSL